MFCYALTLSSGAAPPQSMTGAQYDTRTSTKRKAPSKAQREETHGKRLKVMQVAWATNGSTKDKQPPQIAKKLFSIAERVGDAGVYTYYEAHFHEGSDTPFKVVFVSPNPLGSNDDPKQLNTLRFMMQNVDNPDKVQFITSQQLADNKSDTQNLSVVKRKMPSPPRLLLTTSRVIEVSSSSDEDEDTL